MRRATIITVRTMIVLLLVAAVADLPLPGRSRDRVRLYLVDRSASVLVPGPAESLLPRNVDEIIAHDRATRIGSDQVLWASFAGDVAFESTAVQAGATNLAGALTTALGRNPTEIILCTDGRGDPGSALFLCRDRGIPVHLLPLGPTSVKDVRITRVEAPAEAAADTPVQIAVTVQSTYDVGARVKVNEESLKPQLRAGVPSRLLFTLPKPGDFRIDLDVDDACPENNHVVGQVFPRTLRPQVLLLSARTIDLPGFDVTTAQRIPNLHRFDAVILDDLTLPAEDQRALAAWVNEGGGLILGGGKNSYLLGNWKGTPLEDLSPLQIKPDLRVAAVLAIDSSGSMSTEFESAVDVLLGCRSQFDTDDDVVGMSFGDEAKIMELPHLQKVRPNGGTNVSKGIEAARLHLETRTAGRKVIVLMTDGELSSAETPARVQAEIAKLKDISIIAITTKRDIPGVRSVAIQNWKGLEEALKKTVTDLQEPLREKPGAVEFLTHPATGGLAPFNPPLINRTTAKSGAQVVATVGRPPMQDPVLAFWPKGAGRVGALTVPLESGRLLRQSVEHVMGDGEAGLSLSVDPPFVHARGTAREPVFETTGIKVEMRQTASDRWEGRLPDGLSGTVLVRKGRAKAAATIPCPPEFEKLGVDRAALERIARETGGRVLSSLSDLATLPRPETPAPRSGRTLFLIAALVFVFAELGVSTFWKI